MQKKMRNKTYEQTKLYHGYFNQLWNAGTIRIPIETREWVGDLKEYVETNYGVFSTKQQFKDMARYLLKIMDIELPTTNPITANNPNKNHFESVDKADLTHHISWLHELLHYNKIDPFNETPIYKG